MSVQILNVYRAPVHKLLRITSLSAIVDSLDIMINIFVLLYMPFTLTWDRTWQTSTNVYELQDFGIQTSLLEWSESYLCNRVHSVTIGGGSYILEISFLQGLDHLKESMLGPVLFVVYIMSWSWQPLWTLWTFQCLQTTLNYACN